MLALTCVLFLPPAGFIGLYDEHSKPFMWSATADSVLAKGPDLVKLFMGQDASKFWDRSN